MSFNTMPIKDLREVGTLFGVDLSGMNKSTALRALAEEGVTYESYEAFATAEKVSPDNEGFEVESDAGPQKAPGLVLVKMSRQNPSYEIAYSGKTYLFTLRHPFVAVPEDAADFIFDTEEGFHMATPKEVKAYYG